MDEHSGIIEFVRVVLKRKVIVVFGTIICFLVSILATSMMEPKYQATSKIIISQGQIADDGQSSNESYQALLLSERLAQTFTEIISDRTLAERVIQKLELPIVPENLQKKIEAKSIKDTQLISITVTDSDPVNAKVIANVYALEFLTVMKQVLPSSSMVEGKIVERAVVPLMPVKPNPLSNAVLGFLTGLILSAGLAFMLEFLDVTVKEQEDLESLLGMVSLGKVPVLDSPIVFNSENQINSDFFVNIRTNLQYINFNQSIKTLIISSANQGEGKSTCSANIAAVFAQSGQKTLLVETDLRRPTLATVFGLPNFRGLSNVLAGTAVVDTVISKTAIEGLDIITSGPIPPNPADLLNSSRMDDALSGLKHAYDVIILDAPPILAVADTLILAGKADAVMLVSYYGRTKKSDLVAAKNELTKVGARMVGFVINGMNMPWKGGYYHYQAHSEQVQAISS